MSLLPTANSLIGRLFYASLLLLPLFIIISSSLLYNAFKHSREQAENERLQSHIYLLLSAAEIENSHIWMPDVLAEPRFNQQDSGLYGLILDEQNTILWQSASSALLPATTLALLSRQQLPGPIIPGRTLFFQPSDLFATATTAFNALSHDISWALDDNHERLLRFIVAGDNKPLSIELDAYRNRTWQWLGGMGVTLLLIQLLIMHWGLLPLKQLSAQLQTLQQGESQCLEGQYPAEIQPITDNLNSLLTHEQQQRERYRNSLADLAHSLKTPLAVIQSHADSNSDSIINEQIARMDQIIHHQLQRAVQRKVVPGQQGINVAATVGTLTRTLDKVYRDKHLHWSTYIDEQCYFSGDEADLLEILGNVLDNSCKYGQGRIVITTSHKDNELAIDISDNGQGIDSRTSEVLLRRGARADTAQPGQGIGLAVAVDIISSYDGACTIANGGPKPHLAGACVSIRLPMLLPQTSDSPKTG